MGSFILTTIIVVLALLNALQLVLSFLKDKRQEAAIDKLTSKIMAPTLNDYTINLPKKNVQTQGLRVGGKAVHEVLPIDRVDPEELMQSLANSTGRGGEFEV